MNKKYQVFVSSTYEDLKEERTAISHALLESDCIPAGMELFPGSSRKSWDIIKKVIDESDYYFLIIAGRYGSTKKNSRGEYVSYTELEYNYAKRKKKPIIAFIHDDVGNIPSKKVEASKKGREKLQKFREKVMSSQRQAAFWNDKSMLISAVKTAIHQFKKEDTSKMGWIKVSDIDSRIFDESFNQKVEIIDDWGLDKIFKTRAEKNAESDPKLEKHNLKKIDGIAFGLSSFRNTREKDILKNLCNGMNMRLITMNPDSDFARQRAIEENVSAESISLSIRKLVEWVNKLNSKSSSGKIQIKYYNAMTLDFYWRMDDELYIGPYLYGILSQQTITYKFTKDKRGFKLYTDYFELLWNDGNLCHFPANFIKS